MTVAIILNKDGDLLSRSASLCYDSLMSPLIPRRATRLLLLVLCLVGFADLRAEPIYETKNLVAWCIVPFDNQKRTPEQRAAMVAKMGLTKVAYDWRQEHVAEFEQEILAYKKRGIEFFAFWSVHDEAFRLFEKHQLHPQIWVMMNGKGETQEAKVKSAAEGLLPTIAKAAKIGSKVAIYNHGGWGGEPENMVADRKSVV